ncbi:MAG: hypothetical protein QME66_09480 [Candidatus Eisenbacteria bacterium]|nr:hypothetical protein [Candidatus Eisenbacteria bacterium]
MPRLSQDSLRVELERFKRFLLAFVSIYLLMICLYRGLVFHFDDTLLAFKAVAFGFPICMTIFLLLFETGSPQLYVYLVRLLLAVQKRKNVFLSLVLLPSALGLLLLRTGSLSNYGWTYISISILLGGMLGTILGILLSSKTIVRLRSEPELSKFLVFLMFTFSFALILILYLPNSVTTTASFFLVSGSLGLGVHRIRVSIALESLVKRDNKLFEDAFTVQPRGRICRLFREGPIIVAQIVYAYYRFLSKKKTTEKELAKMKCRIYFRRKKYERVICEVNQYERGYVTEPSASLTSLKALALLNTGEVQNAEAILNQAIWAKRACASPLHMLTLVYIYYVKGELANAVSLNDQVLAMEGGETCSLALNNKAYFLCEQALMERRDDAEYIRKTAKNAEIFLKRAFKYAREPQYIGNLMDTRGFIHMLLGEYREALQCLASASATNAAARFHLALLFMIASRNYYRAEYYLRSALALINKRANKRLYYLVSCHLRLCLKARKQRETFNSRIIFTHLARTDEFLLEPDLLQRDQPGIMEQLEEMRRSYLIESYAGLGGDIVELAKDPLLIKHAATICKI